MKFIKAFNTSVPPFVIADMSPPSRHTPSYTWKWVCLACLMFSRQTSNWWCYGIKVNFHHNSIWELPVTVVHSFIHQIKMISLWCEVISKISSFFQHSFKQELSRELILLCVFLNKAVREMEYAAWQWGKAIDNCCQRFMTSLATSLEKWMEGKGEKWRLWKDFLKAIRYNYGPACWDRG